MNLEAILFDVDGTLSETEELHRDAFNRAFAEAGLPWHWDELLYGQLLRVTGGKERIRHFIDTQSRMELGAEPAAAIARLHAAKTQHYARLVAGGALQLRPGFHALLQEARDAGVRLAIATTTSLPNVTALLQSALGQAAGSYFEVIAAGDSVAHKKPAPDIYLLALAQLRLSPEVCMAVEDSAAGLQSARAAGLTTLVVRSGYTRGHYFEGGALVVDSLTDLPERVQVPGLLAAMRALHIRSTGATAPAAPRSCR
jgi:HAD superfamily hydrolase (TIGR01509 family)